MVAVDAEAVVDAEVAEVVEVAAVAAVAVAAVAAAAAVASTSSALHIVADVDPHWETAAAEMEAGEPDLGGDPSQPFGPDCRAPG